MDLTYVGDPTWFEGLICLLSLIAACATGWWGLWDSITDNQWLEHWIWEHRNQPFNFTRVRSRERLARGAVREDGICSLACASFFIAGIIMMATPNRVIGNHITTNTMILGFAVMNTCGLLTAKVLFARIDRKWMIRQLQEKAETPEPLEFLPSSPSVQETWDGVTERRRQLLATLAEVPELADVPELESGD